MFWHERLEVYQCSIPFQASLRSVMLAIEKGNADVVSQLRRAAMSITLNIADGARRIGRDDQRRFYAIARGSALECAAILDILRTWKLVGESDFTEVRALLFRVVSMLSALLLKWLHETPVRQRNFQKLSPTSGVPKLLFVNVNASVNVPRVP